MSCYFEFSVHGIFYSLSQFVLVKLNEHKTDHHFLVQRAHINILVEIVNCQYKQLLPSSNITFRETALFHIKHTYANVYLLALNIQMTYSHTHVNDSIYSHYTCVKSNSKVTIQHGNVLCLGQDVTVKLKSLQHL